MPNLLAPTVVEVKAELRVDFEDDDSLITNYINSARDHVARKLHWCNPIADNPTEEITIDRSRFCGTRSIRIPRRGIVYEGSTGLPVLTYQKTDAPAQSVTVKNVEEYDNEAFPDQGGVVVDGGSDLTRWIRYLYPTSTWREVFEDIAGQKVRLKITPAQAPADFILAVSKLAVDMYRYNGIASEPMITAVDRLCAPLMDYGG